MSNNIKSKFSSFVTFIIEKSILGYFSKIRKGVIRFIDDFPDTATKLYYAYAILLFFVAISTVGILIITLGTVLIIIALADDSVNKFLLSGILLAVSGLFYFIASLSILKLIGSSIHSSLCKSTSNMLKKVK